MAKITEIGNDMLIFVPKTNIITTLATIFETIVTKKYNIPVHVINKGDKFSTVINWRNRNRNQLRLLIICFGRNFSNAGDEILKDSHEKDIEAKMFERKLFISTPIIESGKTISSVRYCIDMGLELKPIYNPLTFDPYNKMHMLKMLPINKSSATQRYGRIGREQTGTCLRMYSKNTYDMLEESELPETINNYCLSSVLINKLRLLKTYSYYDIINDNNYLYRISLDIHLRSICDLIRSGYFSIFGYVDESIDSIENADNMIMYVQRLYYNEKKSLFEALLITFINKKSLPNDYYCNNKYTSENVMIKLSDLIKTDYINDVEVMDSIKSARNIITMIVYDNTYNTFKYLYDRLF